MVHIHFSTTPLKEGEHTALPQWLINVIWIGVAFLIWVVSIYIAIRTAIDILHKL
jgi:hypothetical protein